MKNFGNSKLISTVSVIIPVYNSENYLVECIKSILAQTYKNLEIILIDDGSTDTSPQICDEFAQKDNRIKVVHQQNSGVSEARNAGLRIATGQYLIFVDSDDLINSEYIETLMHYNADVVVSNSHISGTFSKQEIIERYDELKGFVGPCEKLYNLDVIKGIKFPPNINIGEDIIFNLDVLSVINNAQYIKYKGYFVRDNPNSLTRSYLGKYNPMLDEEYQKWWGDTHSEARRKIGIVTHEQYTKNNCSVWIYQKICNLCYKDCPHSFNEKLCRIKNQIDSNRNSILSADNPSSPKTHSVIKLCTKLRKPLFTYIVFKAIIFLTKK